MITTVNSDSQLSGFPLGNVWALGTNVSTLENGEQIFELDNSGRGKMHSVPIEKSQATLVISHLASRRSHLQCRIVFGVFVRTKWCNHRDNLQRLERRAVDGQ